MAVPAKSREEVPRRKKSIDSREQWGVMHATCRIPSTGFEFMLSIMSCCSWVFVQMLHVLVVVSSPPSPTESD